MTQETLMSKDDVESKLIKALLKFKQSDHHLLSVNANERSMTHRLAIYLEQEFDGWDVDCEYNRMGLNIKSIQLGDFDRDSKEVDDNGFFDWNGKTVFPDIIIHRRGAKDNFIVIEAKKSTVLGFEKQNIMNDFKKLKAYRESELKYRYAYLILFPIDGAEQSDVSTWFKSLDQIDGGAQ